LKVTRESIEDFTVEFESDEELRHEFEAKPQRGRIVSLFDGETRGNVVLLDQESAHNYIRGSAHSEDDFDLRGCRQSDCEDYSNGLPIRRHAANSN